MKNSFLLFFFFITTSLFGQEEQILTRYKIDAGQKVSSIHISTYTKLTRTTIGKIESIRGPLISLLLAENTGYKIHLNDSIQFLIEPMTIEQLNIESTNIHLLADLLNPDANASNATVKTDAKIEEKTEVKPEEKKEVIIEEKTEVKPEEKAEDIIEEKTEVKPEEKIEVKLEEKKEVLIEEKTEVKPEVIIGENKKEKPKKKSGKKS